ncbi:MAG: MopE-related protein [Myxococcota bacterium]
MLLLLAAAAFGQQLDLNVGTGGFCSGWATNGNASTPGCNLQITSASAGVSGSAYHTTTVPIVDRTGFRAHFQLEMAGGDGSGGASGATFLIQSQASTALDTTGDADLGYGGISPSVVVEFDNWDSSGTDDPNGNHVAVHLNGVTNNDQFRGTPGFDMNGIGAPFHVWVDYDGVANQIAIYTSQTATKPGTATTSGTVDLDAVLGPNAWIGFTARSGGSTQNHHRVSAIDVVLDVDTDGDGTLDFEEACSGVDGSGDVDGDGWCADQDCDDGNAAVHPGGTEICDGLDNDCANGVDDGVPTTAWWRDSDGDGFGSEGSTPTLACAAPMGFVGNDTDCDDTSGSAYPGNALRIVGDGLDNDCAGGEECYADSDGDGVGIAVFVDDLDGDDLCTTAGESALDTDCDDLVPERYPGNAEVCDGIDNDCNGVADFAGGELDADSDSVLACDGDCDDSDPFAYPGNPEVCDGIDNDCANGVDDGVAVQVWFADADGDGVGGGSTTGTACAAPNAGDVLTSSDCNDADSTTYPGATEQCDAIDHDCDGQPENGVPQLTWWPDADGDGYGDPDGTTTTACAAPPGSVADDADCDDSEAGVNPAAPEVCDGIDNDCNGLADLADGLPSQSYYADPDGDGWGSGAATVACAPVPGLVTLVGDCDESAPAIHPGAPEVCDSVDNDCDGTPDDGLPTTDYWEDLDGDGFGTGSPVDAACQPPPGFALASGDCDDDDDSAYPGGVEQCDGIDNDCDGLIDDDVLTTDWYADDDGDGYGGDFVAADCLRPAGTVANDLDCDDAPNGGADVNPDALEVCDGIDNDCDGDLDEADADLDGNRYWPDADLDGFGDASVPPTQACTPPAGMVDLGLDCDDGDPSINPAAVEACPDGIDNDCDGAIDADDPNYTDSPVLFWFDQDGDGAGTPSLVFEACSGGAPLGYVPPTNGVDCDDSEFATHPNATEVCDTIDNDCNGLIDEGFTFQDYWPDEDGDGYGDSAVAPIPACSDAIDAVADRIPVGGDCDDTLASVHPGATEICNGLDDDCVNGPDDGLLQIWYLDADLDGYGAMDDPGQARCDDPIGYSLDPLDCNDADADVLPGQDEVCNAIDDDCDGLVDSEDPGLTGVVDRWYADQDGDGLGDPANAIDRCEAPDGYVENDGDCAPEDAARGEDCSPPPVTRKGGCGCQAPGPVPWGLGLLGAIAVVGRRRR